MLTLSRAFLFCCLFKVNEARKCLFEAYSETANAKSSVLNIYFLLQNDDPGDSIQERYPSCLLRKKKLQHINNAHNCLFTNSIYHCLSVTGLGMNCQYSNITLSCAVLNISITVTESEAQGWVLWLIKAALIFSTTAQPWVWHCFYTVLQEINI